MLVISNNQGALLLEAPRYSDYANAFALAFAYDLGGFEFGWNHEPEQPMELGVVEVKI